MRRKKKIHQGQRIKESTDLLKIFNIKCQHLKVLQILTVQYYERKISIIVLGEIQMEKKKDNYIEFWTTLSSERTNTATDLGKKMTTTWRVLWDKNRKIPLKPLKIHRSTFWSSSVLHLTKVRYKTQEIKCHGIRDNNTCLVQGKQPQRNTIKAKGLQRQAISD